MIVDGNIESRHDDFVLRDDVPRPVSERSTMPGAGTSRHVPEGTPLRSRFGPGLPCSRQRASGVWLREVDAPGVT